MQRAFICLAIHFLLTHLAVAGDLSQAEVYVKCYSRITNHPVDIDSQVYKNVKAGTANAVEECMKLLERANLNPTGTVKALANTNDPVRIAILNNFQSFHRSWFTAYGTLPDARITSVYSFIDYGSPALYLTDALLGGQHYSSIFKRTDTIEGIRRGEEQNRYIIEGIALHNRTFIAGPIDEPEDEEDPTDLRFIASLGAPRIQKGYLIGIKPSAPLNIPNSPNDKYRNPLTEASWRSAADDDRVDNGTRHFGGGILGSQAYLLSNLETTARPDGGVRVFRRMAANTMTDLMCLTLPNLKPNQVNAYLNKYKSSELSFRQDRSCAQCHATLDPFAYAFRNVAPALTASSPYQRDVNLRKHPEVPGALNLYYLKGYKVRTNEQTTIDSDNIYFRRRPDGHLYYNNVNGKVIDINVNGIADLGNKLANQLDPYVCAAQRYYGFLTGVNIEVNSGEDNEFYNKHRQLVVRMGVELKQSGSLKELVRRILETDTFQTRFPGAELTTENGQ